MKKYCFDTSGISNPVENMPDDIFESLWRQVIVVIEAGEIAVTTEIYDEMHGSIRSLVGECIDNNKPRMLLEIGEASWNHDRYASVVAAMQIRQHDFISEYNRNAKRTVGLTDISIVALAKALGLPVVSMERPTSVDAVRKRKIPDVCRDEGVEHIDFNTFLRREGIKFQ